MRQTNDRLRRIPHTTVETRLDAVEYTEHGSGPGVLVSHGIFGGFEGALGHASDYIGEGFRAVAPSRFGYQGSSMPPHASAAAQADAFVELLDHLELSSVAMFGFSAGTSAAIQFALRHPARTSALILGSGHYPQEHHKIPAVILRLLYTDRVFWALNTFAPHLLWRIGGVPKTYAPSAGDEKTIRRVMRGLFPITAKRPGAIFDTLVSNPDVNNYPLEEIAVPTLLVHAADDRLAPYETAPPAAQRIPSARLLTLDHGGHLLLGSEPHVRREVAGFIRSQLGASVPRP